MGQLAYKSLWNVSSDKNFDSLIRLLETLNIKKPYKCVCAYDKDLLDIIVVDDVIEIKPIVKKRPFFRWITLIDIEVTVAYDDTLLKIGINIHCLSFF